MKGNDTVSPHELLKNDVATFPDPDNLSDDRVAYESGTVLAVVDLHSGDKVYFVSSSIRY